MIVAVDKYKKLKITKKVAAKKPAAKKTKKISAIATVLGLIQKSLEGIDTATLVKKTGFANNKAEKTAVLQTWERTEGPIDNK